MTHARWLLLLVLAAAPTGCGKPVQSGGLGVFNPNGFEGRVALAGKLADNRVECAPVASRNPEGSEQLAPGALLLEPVGQ